MRKFLKGDRVRIIWPNHTYTGFIGVIAEDQRGHSDSVKVQLDELTHTMKWLASSVELLSEVAPTEEDLKQALVDAAVALREAQIKFDEALKNLQKAA